MSGLEVLGALAAAAQIASYAPTIIKAISKIYGAFQNAPVKIQQGCQHLQELVNTVQAIKQNECLRTPSVEAYLNALMERVIALQRMLTRILSDLDKSRLKRLLTACLQPSHEVRIAEALQQIEGQKSTLVLNILNIHTQLTSSTHESLGEIAKALPILRETRDEDKAIRSLRSTILRKENKPHKRSVITQDRQRFQTPKLDSQVNGVSPSCTEQLCGKKPKSTDRTAEVSTSNVDDLESDDDKPKDSGSSKSHHIYQGVQMRDQVRQINGDVGIVSTISNTKHHYLDVMASGTGLQLNGNISVDGLLHLSSIPAVVQ